MIVKESVKIGSTDVTLETGRIAKQASAAVLVSCGESVVLVTVVGASQARPGTDFLPLTVDYIEKTYAAGKIPGGFFKREGRLREHEILTSRLIDRPCRPLFPDGYRAEVQVVATVLSADRETPTDVLAMLGTSAALTLSPIPWAGPIAGVRVGRVDGQLIANPTFSQLEQSDCELLIAASKDAIVMVEGGSVEMPESELIEAIFFGHEAVQDSLALMEQMREAVGKTKWDFEPAQRDPAIDEQVADFALDGVLAGCNIAEKHPRYSRFKEIKKSCVSALSEKFPEQEGSIAEAYEALRYRTMRSQILDQQRRVDGRNLREVRPISVEIGWLPRTHGSALFTRGETQAIVTTTLGTSQDEQKIDGLTDEYWKRFLLHYNFPAFSVGETKPLRGPGRREIGHGNLAERALARLVPDVESFPYTIRIVSEITESNGSSSMASVCGGTLAMMDAGVPIESPVAGVAMGLVKEGEKYAVLTDILGDEDHLGDMDFKVCGTQKGVTAIQMDIKIDGLSREIMTEALQQALEARLHILKCMNETIAKPREELSAHAPRITTIKVKPDQIRLVIGPGGKMIKAIVDQTGCKIDIADDGTVSIASSDSAAVSKALEIISNLTTEPEVGTNYRGTVRRVEPYGAFLEISPGNDGLLHISDMAWERIERVEDLMNLGDEVEVQVTNIDKDGKIRLSRKVLLEKPEGWEERPEEERRPPRREGRDRDGRDRDGRRRFRDRDGDGTRRRRERPEDGERSDRRQRPGRSEVGGDNRPSQRRESGESRPNEKQSDGEDNGPGRRRRRRRRTSEGGEDRTASSSQADPIEHE
ncbi:MAG: polyribonucleotide nucleotidyltransferase [Myxococcota bacterium]